MSTVVQIADFKIRKEIDDSYWIPRKDSKIEAYMDKHFLRPTKLLVWVERSKFWNLKGKYKGLSCHIIGKGPSLDDIKTLPYWGPIIALNQAVVVIDKLCLPNDLYGAQRDTCLKRLDISKRVIMLTQRSLIAKYYPEDRHYGLITHESMLLKCFLTVLMAVGIANFFGCTEINMWACDASTTGDNSYAKCIPKGPYNTGTLDDYPNQRSRIMKHAEGTPLIWRAADGSSIN